MSLHPKSYIFRSLLILLVAAGFRFTNFSYAYDNVCLSPPDEAWLYEDVQQTTLYTLFVQPQINPDNSQADRLIFSSNNDFLLWRTITTIISLLTIALVIVIARSLKINYTSLVAVFIAVSPWFVWTDRWLVAHDLTHLILAVSVYAILALRNNKQSVWLFIHHLSALSLFMLAPSLWWMTIGLLLATPKRSWKLLLFLSLGYLILSPLLQLFTIPLASLNHWSSGTTASCVLLIVFAVMYLWRNMAFKYHVVLTLIVIISGMTTGLSIIRLQSPTDTQWQLINHLQNIIPDHALVDLDDPILPLSTIIQCPNGHDDLQINIRPARLHSMTINPVASRYDVLADVVVYTQNNLPPDTFAYTYEIGDYFIGRRVDVPNSTAEAIGSQMQLIGYDTAIYDDSTGTVFDLRLDLQMLKAMNVDVLSYAFFIQIAPIDDPSTHYINYNLPFAQELQLLTPRAYNLNRHYRVSLSELPEGEYSVTLGFYNQFVPAEVFLRKSLDIISIRPVSD